MAYKPVDHVIFDMDGLLLDTEEAYKNAFQEVCSKYGKVYTDEIRTKVLGTVPRDSYAIIIKECELPITVDEFEALVQPPLSIAMENVQFMPGAERLVNHLHGCNVPIAIATSSEQHLFEKKMQHRPEFLSKFHHVVVGSSDPEVKRGKPAPDIYLICASRFEDKPDPSRCLVLEDAPNGIKAATDAGMQTVLVPEPLVPQEQRLLATKVISSLLEFKPEEFSLPPFSE